MALLGNGALLTFTGVPVDLEEDFNEWYNREHLDERVDMPGFRRARRYVAVEATPKYFATYETERVEDLAAPAYLAVLADQTPWSKRIMAAFTAFERMTCRATIDRCHGVGGAICLVRCFPKADSQEAFRAWLDQTALPAAVARPGLLGACLWENDLAVANAPARALGLDYLAAQSVEWAIQIEGAEPGPTEAAARAVLSPAALEQQGVDRPPTYGSYRLLFGNSR